MTLLEALKANPEILRLASDTISEFETTGASGSWTLQFHHKPGGRLKRIKLVDRTFEFDIKDLHEKP